MMEFIFQSLAHLLCEMRDVNKSLQLEVDDLKQKLRDANGDIKVSWVVYVAYFFSSDSLSSV